MVKSNKITGGIYLVIDPSIRKTSLMNKVKQALSGGVEMLQIWDHWPESISLSDKLDVIDSIIQTARGFDVPVLINKDWKLLKSTLLDGVHFDSIPDDYPEIKTEINREFISGITCGNDINIIHWAEQNKLDYISFCSMFPSPSAGDCEIVRPGTVKKAKEITQIPIFLSGGITQDNLTSLKELNFNGIAVISGILNAESPEKSAYGYTQALNKLKNTV
ncbi:MAG: thiamine phosphate synthase [Balneolales bacterium]